MPENENLETSKEKLSVPEKIKQIDTELKRLRQCIELAQKHFEAYKAAAKQTDPLTLTKEENTVILEKLRKMSDDIFELEKIRNNLGVQAMFLLETYKRRN